MKVKAAVLHHPHGNLPTCSRGCFLSAPPVYVHPTYPSSPAVHTVRERRSQRPSSPAVHTVRERRFRRDLHAFDLRRNLEAGLDGVPARDRKVRMRRLHSLALQRFPIQAPEKGMWFQLGAPSPRAAKTAPRVAIEERVEKGCGMLAPVHGVPVLWARGHLMREAISRNHQRPCEASRGHPRPSAAIRGHPRPSAAIRGTPQAWQCSALRG